MSTVRPSPIAGRRHPEAPSDYRNRRYIIFGAIVIVLLLLAWWILHPRQQQPAVHALPVSVVTVKLEDMPVQLKSIGTVTPINSVAVKSHVSGQIMAVHFREGQLVKAGQLLFSIDPRPLQAALGQAQADVLNKQAVVAQAQAAITKDQALLVQAQANKAKDIAQANNALVEANRYLGLVKQGAVSREQYETYRTNAVSARATVQADQANIANIQAVIKADRANLLAARAQLAASGAGLRNAQVQLGYASVTAPISGLAGNMQVLAGNLVRADQDTLVTVNQIAPIYVSLTVPDQQFNDVRNYAARGTVTSQAYAPNGGVIESDGHLVFANNQVDTATGTVLLKAVFANTLQKLWPGQFVNMLLTLSVTPHVAVVPDRAVQVGQNGKFVWVVKEHAGSHPPSRPDHTVYMQPVVVGQSVKGMTAILSGLRANQLVVTDGQLQLHDGAHVSFSHMQGL